ncbi:aspartate aminotransferase [Sulfobacillus thermosulfidooxidans DSM 9293]|uniref:Aspartate aminotransferase n=1 Tax=Sulfobacillus thermosulfidooxidans (strain DSM 9293 / VKM B-1269 / AT-1) TaxID=929705 RepID=A0A1W1WGM7_SULTA|nr:alanine--glyoxylate aminotransferase family protein [Sulfobacillus thermosulfidooxidans]SMC05405.1 aspartate aminotransferase [Sulfobacillus thermosulfidooxidans DSM 9293]
MLYPPQILLPGPTPVPPSVNLAMQQAMSDHRGSVFTKVKEHVLAQLQQLFDVGPDGGVAVIPTSGTGALEAAVQNFFLPGDKVIGVSTGTFGERFMEIAEKMGVHVRHIRVPYGQAFDPQHILETLSEERDVKAILVTHNETSTGVLNPVPELAQALRTVNNAPLLIVDSISGVPSIPLKIQADHVDVIVAASQKGFMCPPGLGILALSARAKQEVLKDRPGRLFFDLQPYLNGQFPYTPAVSLWNGLEEALNLLEAEGELPRLARHQLLSRMARAFGQAAGMTPPVEEAIASPTVTALAAPKGITPVDFRNQAAKLGLQIAGAMGPWHHDYIRIGHVGAVLPEQLFEGLATLAHLLPGGFDGIQAAWVTWHNAINVEEEAHA